MVELLNAFSTLSSSTESSKTEDILLRQDAATLKKITLPGTTVAGVALELEINFPLARKSASMVGDQRVICSERLPVSKKDLITK